MLLFLSVVFFSFVLCQSRLLVHTMAQSKESVIEQAQAKAKQQQEQKQAMDNQIKQQQAKQEQKQQQEEYRRVVLNKILSPEARNRLSNLKMVKEDKAIQVENMLSYDYYLLLLSKNMYQKFQEKL